MTQRVDSTGRTSRLTVQGKVSCRGLAIGAALLGVMIVGQGAAAQAGGQASPPANEPAAQTPSAAPSAAAGSITLELNKLEPVEKGCRVYTVVDNPGSTTFQSMKLDLIVFHTDGVIGRRLMLDLAPLKSAKKTVKMFELDGTQCEKIGSFLLHDVMECKSDAGPVEKCLENIAVKSLSNVQLSK